MNWQTRALFTVFVQACLGFFLTSAKAQDEERLVLAPPLGEAFPLELKPEGMHLKYPVLLNARTVIGPDVVLRFIYVDPNAALHPHGGGGGGDQNGGGGGGGHGHHHGGGGDGDGGEDSADSSLHTSKDVAGVLFGTGPNGAKEVNSEIRTEVWTQDSLFREALDDAADMGTTLVYSVPGKPKPLSTTINLPDGMLLAKVDGQITVLAMTSESKAYQGGVRPDDEIRSINGAPSPDSLTDFARNYSRAKEDARQGDKAYVLEVWRPAQAQLVTIQVAAPPSLPKLF